MEQTTERIDDLISQVERFYRSLTGQDAPPTREVPYAPIPPERDPEPRHGSEVSGPAGAGPSKSTNDFSTRLLSRSSTSSFRISEEGLATEDTEDTEEDAEGEVIGILPEGRRSFQPLSVPSVSSVANPFRAGAG